MRGGLAKELYELIHRVGPRTSASSMRLICPAPESRSRAVSCRALKVDDETVGGIVLFPRAGWARRLDFLAAQEATFALSAQLIRGHVAFRDSPPSFPACSSA